MTTELEETLKRLQSRAPTISLTKLYTLSGLLQDEQQLVEEAWIDIEVETRRRIVREMAELAEYDVHADFTAVFRHALHDPDAAVRAEAIDGLWESENVKVMFLLLEILQDDPDEDVRARAAAGLGRFVLAGELGHLSERGTARIVDALYDVIQDRVLSTELRRRAVESIAYSSDERVRGVITRVTQEPNRKMRVSALYAMGRSADPYWRETVRAALRDDDPEMRYEAARAAGELEDPAAIELLIELLEDPDSEVRQAAIWSLGQIGGERAKKALQNVMRHGDPVMVEAAEEAMAMLKLNAGVFDPTSFVDVSFDLEDVGVEDATEVHSYEELDEELEPNRRE